MPTGRALSDYLARHPNGPFRSEARFQLADALAHVAAGDRESRQLYRTITIEDPLSSWADKASFPAAPGFGVVVRWPTAQSATSQIPLRGAV